MIETRKPKVFRLGAEQAVTIDEQPDAFMPVVIASADIPLKPRERRFSLWTKLFWSALTGLITLALGMWFWRLIDELYRTNVYVGWLGAALLALAVVALLVLIVREVRGLMRLTAASVLREDAELAAATDDGDKARSVVQRLMAFQASDPSTAAQRQAMAAHMGEIIDGKGLLTLADRTLMTNRDELAKAVIASAAKRVSVVTAISPRAIVDVMFVAAQSVMLTRRVAEIYGARPGTLGFMRLGRRILGHLAITGGVAITDSVLSQLVGHGLAARLSAKLGEGVLNGLLTARVGLAVIAACRPLPFLATEEPKLQDVAGEILSNPFGKKE
jgi:putative membrane protein